ncbi:ester cyclase [Salipiger abyssi]|uniref:nuclear transport factor 2 family protein n=1 Tax=Salipiger abyssi TaxID=1250539 RepID=UPI001A8DC408|nr:ester cyclase [Salipiger abyssi]MBN9886178.1 ester cyclase [Salipiger abyssi]
MGFLAGFDDRWQDAASYLDALRHDLGEGQRLDLVPEYLAPDVVVQDGAAVLSGPEAVGTALAARRAALPGLSLCAEETLWSASAPNAFVAAQRFQCRARHGGPGLYGAPGGRALSYLEMSESWCVSGALRAQWVLRDELAILAQIGVTPEEGARWRLSQMAGPEEPPDMPDPGPGNDDAWGHTLGDLVHRIMSGDLSVIARHYDPAAELFQPGAVIGHGPAEAEAFWLGLRAALPSARFEVQHLLGAEEHLSPPRAAIRWALTGTHDGHGVFGSPSGAEVTVLGMTQAEFGPDGLRREWTLYDAPGVLAQILRARG